MSFPINNTTTPSSTVSTQPLYVEANKEPKISISQEHVHSSKNYDGLTIYQIVSQISHENDPSLKNFDILKLKGNFDKDKASDTIIAGFYEVNGKKYIKFDLLWNVTIKAQPSNKEQTISFSQATYTTVEYPAKKELSKEEEAEALKLAYQATKCYELSQRKLISSSNTEKSHINVLKEKATIYFKQKKKQVSEEAALTFKATFLDSKDSFYLNLSKKTALKTEKVAMTIPLNPTRSKIGTNPIISEKDIIDSFEIQSTKKTKPKEKKKTRSFEEVHGLLKSELKALRADVESPKFSLADLKKRLKSLKEKQQELSKAYRKENEENDYVKFIPGKKLLDVMLKNEEEIEKNGQYPNFVYEQFKVELEKLVHEHQESGPLVKSERINYGDLYNDEIEAIEDKLKDQTQNKINIE